MDFHRWSSLFRSYDVTLRHNRLLLVMTIAGAIIGLALGRGEWRTGVINAAAIGWVVFLAGALAKELYPDYPQAALPAAGVALLLSALVIPPFSIALLWLLGCSRFLNRTTGLRPKPTDLIALMAVTGWLVWRETPLFGILIGVMLIMDSALSDGNRIHAVIGVVVFLASGAWLIGSDWSAAGPTLLLILALLAIAVSFFPVILGSYQIQAVGDATGEALNPARVQAGQVFALSTGLLLASLYGERGIMVLTGLWAAIAGCAVAHLLFVRSQLPASSL